MTGMTKKWNTWRRQRKLECEVVNTTEAEL